MSNTTTRSRAPPGAATPRLRDHPHHAVQCRARGRHAERGALQALHHAGRALPDRLRTRADARRRQGADAGAPDPVREVGAKARSWSSARCTARSSSDTASPPTSSTRRRCRRPAITTCRICMAAAYAEPYEVLLGALLPCFWIYAEVGRDIHARAAAGQSLSGLDRHLCRRAVPRRRPRHHRGHRRGRRDGV